MQTLKLMYIPQYTHYFFSSSESDLKARHPKKMISDITTSLESKLLHITL